MPSLFRRLRALLGGTPEADTGKRARSRRLTSGRAGRSRGSAPLRLDPLEGRVLPAVVLTHPDPYSVMAHVQIHPVFVGDQWNSGTAPNGDSLSQYRTELSQFLDDLASSSYFVGGDKPDGTFVHGLDQYGISTGQVVTTPGGALSTYTVSTQLGSTVTDGQIRGIVSDAIYNGDSSTADPRDFHNRPQTLYFVFVEPGVAVIDDQGTSSDDPTNGFGGYHLQYSAFHGQTYLGEYAYGIVCFPDNRNPFNELTATASHELAEAVTDPDPDHGSGWVVDDSRLDQSTDEKNLKGQEVGDLAQQGYFASRNPDLPGDYQENGELLCGAGNTYLVQKFWSNDLNGAVLPPNQINGFSLFGGGTGTFEVNQMFPPSNTGFFSGEVAEFTDGLTGNTDPTKYDVSIDWGDGTMTAGQVTRKSGTTNVFEVSGQHWYTLGAGSQFGMRVFVGSSLGVSALGTAQVTLGGDVVIPGTSAGDTLVLRHTPGGGTGAVTYQLNGATPVALTGVTGFTFQGLGGDDKMIIDYANGSPTDGLGVIYDGGTGTNTLQTSGGGGSWHIVAHNAGTVNDTSIIFTHTQNLTGGAEGDTFVVSAAGFIDGDIDGGGGSDTLDLAALTPQTVTLDALGSVDGFDGTVPVNTPVDHFHNIDALVGPTQSDHNELVGLDANAAWFLRPAGSDYRDNASGHRIVFDAFQKLTGSSGPDLFTFEPGAHVVEIDGKGGSDTLDFTDLGAQTVTLTSTGGVDGFNGFPAAGGPISAFFANIDAVVGSGGGNDTLIGLDGDATWFIQDNVSTVSHYRDTPSGRSLFFAGFENLAGGSGADIFDFKPGGAVGDIDGKGGADTLDFTDLGAQTVRVQSLGATDGFNGSTAGTTPISGFFHNIDAVVGSSGSGDTLIGRSADAIWFIQDNVSTVSHYRDTPSSRSLFFAGFENLAGGSSADIFDFKPGGSVSGQIDGQGGADTLDFTDLGAQTVTLTGLGALDGFDGHTADTASLGGGFHNIDAVVGSSGSGDKLIGRDADAAFAIDAAVSAYQDTGSGRDLAHAGFENLTGGSGDDVFRFTDGAGVSGILDGGGGVNTLDYSAYTTPVTVDLQHGTATATGGIAHITNVIQPDRAPTDLALSVTSVPENSPAGTVVGSFSTTDPDAGEAFTYRLVAGAGGDDNAAFTINGAQLRLAVVPDFETKAAYRIRVQSTDRGGLTVEKPFTIRVTNVNEAPTDLALSPSSVPENSPVGTVVGIFSTTDPDTGDSFTYALVPGTGGDDNAAFTVSGAQLRLAVVPDFDAKASYSIRVQATDHGGLSAGKPFAIRVTYVDESPSGSTGPGSTTTGTTGSGSTGQSVPPGQTGGSTGTVSNPGGGPGGVTARPTTAAVFDPATGTWFLRDSNSAGAPTVPPFTFGAKGWTAVRGDWNGDGTPTIGAVDPKTATWYLRNTDGPGAPDYPPFAYGTPGWNPVAGDWDGDGTATAGTFDPVTATWYLRDSNSPGAPDIAPFRYGAPGWIPVVGDWNGDGVVTIGTFDPKTATWYLKNDNHQGEPSIAPFRYGAPGWIPVVGDWNGTGETTIGVIDPATGLWYLRDSNSPGAPTVTPFRYGGKGSVPATGGSVTVGLLRAGDGERLTVPPPDALTAPGLQMTVAAALSRLQQAGVSPQLLAQLAAARFEIGNLAGPLLEAALPSANRVIIDTDAAGHGWFVDPSPLQDEEFALAPWGALYAQPGTPAEGKMDLLSVVLHGLGQLAGLPDVAATDSPGDVRADLLGAGNRLTAVLDRAFGGNGF